MKSLLLFVFALLVSSFIQSQESLKIVWLEEYEWKAISNQENDNIHIMNIVPGNEDAENWATVFKASEIIELE
ncbi:MAG: hypothetical protein AAGF87_06985 [Bacteroidota bacterium]